MPKWKALITTPEGKVFLTTHETEPDFSEFLEALADCCNTPKEAEEYLTRIAESTTTPADAPPAMNRLAASMGELVGWMRSRTGSADGTHEMLCRAVNTLAELGFDIDGKPAAQPPVDHPVYNHPIYIHSCTDEKGKPFRTHYHGIPRGAYAAMGVTDRAERGALLMRHPSEHCTCLCSLTDANGRPAMVDPSLGGLTYINGEWVNE